VSSETQIANLALSHLGVGKTISNIETDRGDEALACRTFYDVARDEMLRGFPWPFATRIVDLALVEEDPNDEWAYSYRYPTNCMKLRRVLSGIRNDTRQTRVPYKEGADDDGLLIFTDKEDAQLEYTVREENPERFPVDFTLALSFLLAGYIAPRLTAGDPLKKGDFAMRMSSAKAAMAAATAVNEQQDEEPPETESIAARG